MSEDVKAIEKQAENSESSAEEKVSHEDLSDAWDKMKAGASDTAEEEEESSEEQESDESGEDKPDKEKEEELSHGDKSRLGRKIKRLETTLSERDKKIDELTNSIAELRGFMEGKMSTETEEEADDDTVLTIGDFKRLQKQDRERAEQARNADNKKLNDYRATYMGLMEGLSEDNPDLYAKVEPVMRNEFNDIDSWNPEVDFINNLAKAELRVLKQESEKPKPKLKGEKAKGTVVGDTDKVKPNESRDVDISKLPPEDRAFLERVKKQGRDPQKLANETYGEKR